MSEAQGTSSSVLCPYGRMHEHQFCGECLEESFDKFAQAEKDLADKLKAYRCKLKGGCK